MEKKIEYKTKEKDVRLMIQFTKEIAKKIIIKNTNKN